MQAMKSKTVTITVSASFDEVFDFLAQPENMPDWALHFCKAIRNEDGRWIATTPNGDLFIAVDTNKAGGCIDMYGGPALETMSLFPIRVIRADGGLTAVVFSLFKCEGEAMSEAAFEMQYRSLVDEAHLLAKRFGGGDVCSEASIGSRLAVGIVSEEIELTKAFYTRYFGFKAVFDGPMYAHLTRASGGEQIGIMKASAIDDSHTEFDVATNGNGMWLSFDVENVDAEFQRLKDDGLAFVQDPVDQPWGERVCVARDPNGVLVYLGQKIDSMDEELRKYIVDDAVLAGA